MSRSAPWLPGAVAALIATVLPAAVARGADLRRVGTVRATQEPFAPDLTLTGTVAARYQTNVAFRVAGRVTDRRVEVGQHVTADQVIATLDPKEQQAVVGNAEAALASAQALLKQAQDSFDRQKSLLSSGYTTRASFDQAQATLEVDQAQVRTAQANLNTAREQLSYADLRAGADGIIVSRSVEAGQVVQAGQTVFVLAQDGSRDAVFAVPEALVVRRPVENRVDVALQADPAVTTSGTIREVAPIIDPATSTVLVKVGLASTPPAMTLGAAVVGIARWQPRTAVRLPWSALVEIDGKPAVWVLDPDNAVTLQPVVIESYVDGAVLLASGPTEGQSVVTAGGQLLFPGQRVTPVAGAEP